jgi:hypothetical protein
MDMMLANNPSFDMTMGDPCVASTSSTVMRVDYSAGRAPDQILNQLGIDGNSSASSS